MTSEKGKRAAYTLEYKLEAVRLVQGGQESLRKLESSARQAAQVISNLPHVEKIRLPKIDFTSAILPIAPPPPRRFA